MNMKTYQQACRQIKTQGGVSHATDDAESAVYAQAISAAHGGSPEAYYDYITGKYPTKPLDAARPLLGDRAKAWDVLMGIQT